MDKAYIPQTGRALTVPEYVKQFGPKLSASGAPLRRPIAQCRVCQILMHTKNENIPGRVQGWAHNPSTTWCPLKDSAKVPYQLLTPTQPDKAAGRRRREDFLWNWKHHWGLVRSIVPRCDINQLIDFIGQADNTGFWDHVDLEEWYLPYIFLSFFEFPPPKTPAAARGQPTWIRCYFDARVRGYRDLWIQTNGSWGFFVAHYQVPARGASPGPKHLISDAPYAVDNTFLTRPAPVPHPFAENAMRAKFPGEVP